VEDIEICVGDDFDIGSWVELYHSAGYHEHWTEANAEAARRYAHLIVTTSIDATLVGTLTVWSDGLNFAWLDDVVVRPGRQGCGIGSRLVMTAIERTRPSVRDIQVFPIPGRESFFGRFGFVVQPDALVMDLTPPVGGAFS
jgi:predicted N-acetyltransferase YhbS